MTDNPPQCSVLSVVLGAGASRDVQYAQPRKALPSPLDSDFFDLLQRLAPSEKDEGAVFNLLQLVRNLPNSCWRSMEQAFYTLHLEEQMNARLNPLASAADLQSSPIVSLFVQCIQALLRSAHGRNSCSNHRAVVDRLHESDAILSFNYDLVIERALRDLASDLHSPNTFGQWVYGRGARPAGVDIPSLFKLHGSSNWQIGPVGEIEVKSSNWEEAFSQPGYVATRTILAQYPILLPYWDKPIEQEPWLSIWKEAYRHLSRTEDLLVWGYSLPLTDMKARYLFTLPQGDPAKLRHICVIDPGEQTQQRWRGLFPDAQYWAYRSFDEFRKNPPEWWINRQGNVPNWPGRIS